MSGVIIIHEFSTGIEIFGTPDDWYVGGFTGKYINSTMSSIPPSVQDAISGGYFKMAEGKSSSKSSVIGREIIVSDIEQWSVVAVVTKGQEESGRTASLYRYFLTKEINNIGHILQWMYQEKSGLLAFNPFDKQEIGHYHKHQTTSSKLNLKPQLQNLLPQSPPIIVPYDEPCVPLILNEMANELDNPKSWAFNVTGLDKPRSFQIIQPADYDSEKTIRQIISKTSKQPRLQGQERAALTAIRNLTNSNTFKLQYLSTIEKELNNKTLGEDDWEDIFNQLGAKQELKEKNYAPSMIRLLTLRAMVLPGTLPKFLTWIEQASNQDHYNTSSIFQSEVFQNRINCRLAYLRERIIDGVKYIISHLVEDPELVNSTIKLLTDEQGIWKHYYKTQVMPALDHDFKLLSQYYLHPVDNVDYKIFNHPGWQRIYDRLRNFWQPTASKYAIQEYQPIADLFLKLSTTKNNRGKKSIKEVQLSALFQYVSQHIIPDKIFKTLKRSLGQAQIKDGLYISVYGIWLKRQVPLQEKLYVATLQIVGEISRFLKWLWNSKVPFPLMMLLAAVYTSILLGLLSILSENPISLKPKVNIFDISWVNEILKSQTSQNQATQSPDNSTPNNISNNNRPQSSKNTNSNPDPFDIEEAYRNFDLTQKVIKNEILTSLNSDYTNIPNKSGELNKPNELETEIKIAIRKTLDRENELNLQYALAIDEQNRNKNGEEKYKREAEKWIKAIYTYQQQKKTEKPSINAVGYLLPGGQTNEHLREDVKKNISPEFKNK